MYLRAKNISGYILMNVLAGPRDVSILPKWIFLDENVFPLIKANRAAYIWMQQEKIQNFIFFSALSGFDQKQMKNQPFSF